MSSRNDMDRPAVVLAALVGIVLIGVSLPFLILDGNDGSDRFNIAWTEAAAPNGSAQGNLAVGSTTEVPIRFDSILPSNATVTITCDDGATPPLQNEATVSWQLRERGNSTVLASGNGCTTAAGERAALDSHPDVGRASAESAEAAEEAATGDAPRPVEYVLTVTVSRAGPSQVPGQLQPTFSGTARLAIEEWVPTANEPGQEGAR